MNGGIIAGTLGLSSGWAAIGVAAVTASLFDMVADPVAVHMGVWRWKRSGRWEGIPAGNFLGWALTAGVTLTVVRAVAGLPGQGILQPSPLLAGLPALGLSAGFAHLAAAAKLRGFRKASLLGGVLAVLALLVFVRAVPWG